MYLNLKECGRLVCLLSLIIAVMGLASTLEAATYRNEPLLAMGKGFIITQSDMDEFADYFKDKFSFQTKPEEYRRALVLMWLFSLEAQKLGLGEFKTGEVQKVSVEEMNRLRRHYLQKILDEHPVSKEAIESYYWAHPDKFYDKKNPDAAVFPEPDLLPLDSELREKIRYKIVKSQRDRIIDEAFERLFAEYKVRYCNAEGDCQ